MTKNPLLEGKKVADSLRLHIIAKYYQEKIFGINVVIEHI